ncbi:GntR family transcriptional regulator [Flexivirga alba]|uniref:GntR family transcriptional regulator n=1 Tax=Flexivirga alba TaxID=702742 RepID=A0ABW2AJ16_9MICO
MTKFDQAYAALRRAIVTGELREDEPLDDLRLSETFGFGRTPMREALKRLADEQFIMWPAHRTPYVRGMKISDLSRLYEARVILESPVARQAAERRTPAQLGILGRVLDELDSAVDDGNVYTAVELDLDFHQQVAIATDNRFLADCVKRLNCGSLRLWYIAHAFLGMAGVNDAHRGILSAIAAGNADLAEKETIEHIQDSYQRQIDRQRVDLDKVATQQDPTVATS